MRDYLAAVLPGLSDRLIQRLPELIPSILASPESGNNFPRKLLISVLPS
jgi:hypothetical protein